jgi:hypothetical protein
MIKLLSLLLLSLLLAISKAQDISGGFVDIMGLYSGKK